MYPVLPRDITNVEVEKRMPWLNKRSTEFEKRRLYVKTTNKLNFDRKNASYKRSLLYMQNTSLKVWKFETPVLHINLVACTRIAFSN